MPKKKKKNKRRPVPAVNRPKTARTASQLPARSGFPSLLKQDPTDFSEDGKCSRCGGCCASVFPISDAEVASLREYAKEHDIKPAMPEGPNVAYLQCPFLEKHEDGRTGCLVYEIRPAVCRVFHCHNGNRQNAQAWIDAHGETDPPDPDNVWKVFNLTGLRLDGQDVPYDKAPFCRIDTAEGVSYQFHVGRPASFILSNKRHIPFGIVTGLFQNGIEMFDGNERKLTFVPFKDIEQVLSDRCIVPPLPVHDAENNDRNARKEGSGCPTTKA